MVECQDETKPFDLWFSECILICAENHIGDDDYVWSVDNCAELQSLYDLGYSAEEAVSVTFGG